jgi:hypothetical protein
MEKVLQAAPAARGANPSSTSSISSTFTELRAHTGFSFGDGAITPERLVMRARQLGYTSLGITDTADLGAVPRFVTEAHTIAKDPGCRHAASHTEEPCALCERPLRSMDIPPRSSFVTHEDAATWPRSSPVPGSGRGRSGTRSRRENGAGIHK